MQNTQAPVSRCPKGSGQTLNVHSIFHSIQGEGPFAGCRALFIRLAGCNLQCPKCDTEYTNGALQRSVEELTSYVKAHSDGVKGSEYLVVLTGGEPFRQDLEPLVVTLSNLPGVVVQIETNGSLDPGFNVSQYAIVVCSPKLKIHPKMEPHIHALKYVLSSVSINWEDGLPTAVLGLPKPPARLPGFEGVIYVQPADNKSVSLNHRNLQACIESVQKFGYTLCVQLHKFIGME